jgi:hypothetical protein
MIGDPIEERAALYLRAEKPTREFFGRHFGRLCAACGAAARQGMEHLCCCVGVQCTRHLDRSPVLAAILKGSGGNSRFVDEARGSVSGSLLGPDGCRLDWGRPAPCNAVMCTPQRDCLRVVMPLAQVASLSRALCVFHLIADPRLRNLTTLTRLVAELESEIAGAERKMADAGAGVNAAIDEAIATLRRTAGVAKPAGGSTAEGADSAESG